MDDILMRLDALQRIHDLETLLRVRPAAVYDVDVRKRSAELCLGLRLSFKEARPDFDSHCDALALLVDEFFRSADTGGNLEPVQDRIHEHLAHIAHIVRPRA
jgi:hypothetical protein